MFVEDRIGKTIPPRTKGAVKISKDSEETNNKQKLNKVLIQNF